MASRFQNALEKLGNCGLMGAFDILNPRIICQNGSSCEDLRIDTTDTTAPNFALRSGDRLGGN
jgi:hypothetical protein